MSFEVKGRAAFGSARAESRAPLASGRGVRVVLAAVLALGSLACPSKDVVPGSEVMGTYRFSAEVERMDCALDEFTADYTPPLADGGTEGVTGANGGFVFDATFSWTPATDEAWLTLSDPAREQANEGPFGLYRLLGLNPQQNQPRPGRWDGQEFRSTDEVARVFPSKCGECGTSLEESLDVLLLSRSQSAALLGQCPPSLFDAGLPAGPDVTPPVPTAYGFDAVRGCGNIFTRVLATTLTDGGACDPACSSCRVVYRVTGERR